MSVEVIKPGLLTSLQDAGRRGYAHLGLGRAGAVDEPARQLANALVGNVGDEAVLEITLAGPTLRFQQEAVVALTGGLIEGRVEGQALPAWTSCFLPAGSVLRLGGMRHGCRSYLAVRGGFDCAPVLGSRSTDLHAGVGPLQGKSVQAGDVIAIGGHAAASWFQATQGMQALRWDSIRNRGSTMGAHRWRCCAAIMRTRWTTPRSARCSRNVSCSARTATAPAVVSMAHRYSCASRWN